MLPKESTIAIICRKGRQRINGVTIGNHNSRLAFQGLLAQLNVVNDVPQSMNLTFTDEGTEIVLDNFTQVAPRHWTISYGDGA